MAQTILKCFCVSFLYPAQATEQLQDDIAEAVTVGHNKTLEKQCMPTLILVLLWTYTCALSTFTIAMYINTCRFLVAYI